MPVTIKYYVFNGKTFDVFDEEKQNALTEKTDKHKVEEGVWCLCGQKTDNEPWEYLQVGQSKDLKTELAVDVKCIKHGCIVEEKDYINQFGKCVGRFWAFPEERYQVYSQIGKDYQDGVLSFFVIEIEDEKQRTVAEKIVAYETLARYWRNGGSFKTELAEDKRAEHVDNLKNNSNQIEQDNGVNIRGAINAIKQLLQHQKDSNALC